MKLSVLLSWAFVFGVSLSVADGRVIKVSPGESIQAALDVASPGDTVSVSKGTYQEKSWRLYGLRISTDNVKLVRRGGGIVRILHNGDQETGVYAAPPGCNYRDKECEEPNLKNIVFKGITVEGFPANGIQTRWVDGFKVDRCRSIDNLKNGLYLTLSSNGVVESSFSTGSLDSALWVAGSTNVVVKKCELTRAPTGLEITVSNEVLCVENYIHGNTVGVGFYHPNMAGNPPPEVMKNWVLRGNKIYSNNLVNLAPQGSFQSALLPGVGILVAGVSGHTIRDNDIQDNASTGLAMFGLCTLTAIVEGLDDCSMDPPISDPSANNMLVSDNVFKGNAFAQLPAPFPSGLDIVYFQEETNEGNCFENNCDPDELVTNTLPTDGCDSEGEMSSKSKKAGKKGEPKTAMKCKSNVGKKGTHKRRARK